MFILNEIFDEARHIMGACSDERLLRWISDGVALIANKADLDGLRGTLDICTTGCGTCGGDGGCNGKMGSVCNSPAGCGRKCVTLPREVETILGINIGGQPVLFKGELFSFHLNGPGDCRTICDWSAQDKGHNFCTLRDIITPSKLVTYLETEEDNGKKFIVYGFDKFGQTLKRQENGVWVDGYQVPTVFGAAIPDTGAPEVARITNIFKDLTVGNMRLATVDSSGTTGINLGIYMPDEQVPNYCRLQLNRSCNWVRIAYIKTNPRFRSRYDHVPLRSPRAVLLAVQAIKHYNEKLYADAHLVEADAARIEIEAQLRAEPPTYFPVQVVDMSQPRDKYDWDIR
jgi:hypothetical protein